VVRTQSFQTTSKNLGNSTTAAQSFERAQPGNHKLNVLQHHQKSCIKPTTRVHAMLITRGFSLTNFVIGSSALCFQIFVLYPWHEKLEEKFRELQKDHLRLLEDIKGEHKDELKSIRKELELLNAKKRSGNFWL
jgi:hypothetical protein